MTRSAFFETAKATVRYIILFAPVLLQALDQIELGAWGAVISIILTAGDKGVHEIKTGKLAGVQGIVPF